MSASAPRRVVIDTNVVISGMLSPFRAASRVLDLVIAGELTPLVDDRILAEYREVARRPKFGFDAGDVEWILSAIESVAEAIAARPIASVLPDPDDLVFLEVAVAGAADALVTGNTRHFEPVSGRHAVPVVSPRELLDGLAGRLG
ncbi:MAG: putative toxin-antitoxin system toxin component, PIN family [Gemmatimonadetes bacterium]|nr:putative toxin-antitoxin system toxin component, PIN family [Gemmatimonadota bacterium]